MRYDNTPKLKSSSLLGYHTRAIFYPKYNAINLLYSGALIYGIVLSTIKKNLIEFCNIYQFIQRMNKAYHISSSFVISL